MKLSKRAYQFPEMVKVNQKFKSFTLPQRERKILSFHEPPKHGVSQPMPPRKAL